MMPGKGLGIGFLAFGLLAVTLLLGGCGFLGGAAGSAASGAASAVGSAAAGKAVGN